ncbi:MAG: hypothetical protein U5J63_04575 [Fodinibius sp.]|nr:hypothetical protein [Fodinibius sp.]
MLAQFAGTSLWFAGNADDSGLVQELQLSHGRGLYRLGGNLISGTLLFAFLTSQQQIAIKYSDYITGSQRQRAHGIQRHLFTVDAQPVCHGLFPGGHLSRGDEDCL